MRVLPKEIKLEETGSFTDLPPWTPPLTGFCANQAITHSQTVPVPMGIARLHLDRSNSRWGYRVVFHPNNSTWTEPLSFPWLCSQWSWDAVWPTSHFTEGLFSANTETKLYNKRQCKKGERGDTEDSEVEIYIPVRINVSNVRFFKRQICWSLTLFLLQLYIYIFKLISVLMVRFVLGT